MIRTYTDRPPTLLTTIQEPSLPMSDIYMIHISQTNPHHYADCGV